METFVEFLQFSAVALGVLMVISFILFWFMIAIAVRQLRNINIPAGATIEAQMLGVKKPGSGIPARQVEDVIGKVATCDIAKDTLISEEMLRA